jgi:hypothetical protein
LAGHYRSPFFPSQYNLLVPCRYVIDKERRLIVSTGWDRLTFAEAKAHDDQLFSDPDFNPEFNQLIDATAVTVMDMSIDEAKSLARRAIVSRTSRRAFVATNPAIFGMGRLVGTHDEIAREQEQAGVFRDLYSALKWLGLESLPQ